MRFEEAVAPALVALAFVLLQRAREPRRHWSQVGCQGHHVAVELVLRCDREKVSERHDERLMRDEEVLVRDAVEDDRSACGGLDRDLPRQPALPDPCLAAQRGRVALPRPPRPASTTRAAAPAPFPGRRIRCGRGAEAAAEGGTATPRSADRRAPSAEPRATDEPAGGSSAGSPSLIVCASSRVASEERDAELDPEAIADAPVGGEGSGPVARASEAGDQRSLRVLVEPVEGGAAPGPG